MSMHRLSTYRYLASLLFFKNRSTHADTPTVRPEVLVELVPGVVESGLGGRQPLAQRGDGVVADLRVELLDVGHQRRPRLADILLVTLKGAEVGTALFSFR